MKKIMFNDKYGLTDAVLQGRKTMTRRTIKVPNRTIGGEDVCGFEVYKTLEGIPFDVWLTGEDEETLCQLLPTYRLGEEVAVAQSYKDLGYTKEWVEQHISPNPNAKPTDPFEKKYPGWNNKMFVPAELNMAQRIGITDIKVERLQDISDEDCMKEGVVKYKDPEEGFTTYGIPGLVSTCDTPREAFAYLIDKVSGKGTWERNPYVFAYEFELVKEGGAE